MADIVDRQTRSRMMSGIRGKNTLPEGIIRKRLHARGFRFRLHRRDLPGAPDIVLPKYSAVILVNGCFWHGHDCRLFRWPKTRPEFWRKKLRGNIRRDERNIDRLRELGWRVCVVWECEIKGVGEESLWSTIDDLTDWIKGCVETKSIPHSRTQV